MEHFASFIVCTLLLLNVYGTEGSLTSQQQCSVRNVCNLLDNVSNRQDHLEKKVKEHSAILCGRCDEGKVNEHLPIFLVKSTNKKISSAVKVPRVKLMHHVAESLV